MRYGSVRSGIEAATVAWHPLNWSPVFFSEIADFPSKVLAHHYPEVPNRGDFTQINDIRPGDIDLLVGGTPCQSFSIAGLRGGLADSRGNLALEFMRLAQRAQPRWVVWENVPGVLSSNEGRDFGSILGALGELGYGFAYRVLDAQFFGVPQRRRRVFVVGCLGNQNAATAVLLEREGVFRNPPSRRTKRNEVAGTLGAGSKDGGWGGDLDRSGALVPTQRVAHSLTCHAAKGGDPTTDNYVVQSIAQNQRVVGTLLANGKAAGSMTSQDINAGCYVVQSIAQNQRGEVAMSDVTQALSTGGGKPGQGYPAILGFHPTQDPISGPISPCLSRTVDGMGVLQDMVVRRLTPVECERLQGFPDEYTNIPSASDTARYRALGNSFAVPVVRWIGRRIDHVDRLLRPTT